MKNERYQIIYKVIICGKECECLCGVKTASGDGYFAYSREEAEKRVAELIEAGYEARYSELPYGEAWFDDNNWIG
jgi:hypothetical protein